MFIIIIIIVVVQEVALFYDIIRRVLSARIILFCIISKLELLFFFITFDQYSVVMHLYTNEDRKPTLEIQSFG